MSINRRARLTAVACAVGLGLAACGGDDDQAQTSPAETGAEETAQGGETAAEETAQGTDLRAAFDQFLRETLRARGLPDEAVECAVDRLRKVLSNAELRAVITGGVTPAVKRLSQRAGLYCATRGD